MLNGVQSSLTKVPIITQHMEKLSQYHNSYNIAYVLDYMISHNTPPTFFRYVSKSAWKIVIEKFFLLNSLNTLFILANRNQLLFLELHSSFEWKKSNCKTIHSRTFCNVEFQKFRSFLPKTQSLAQFVLLICGIICLGSQNFLQYSSQHTKATIWKCLR